MDSSSPISDFWAIVLAAGSSTRMGKQKMLLPFGSTTIVEKVIDLAMHAVKSDVIVVTGSHHHEISCKINHLPVKTVYNPDYTEGMLSSVIAGINALPSSAKAFLLFLGDQPHIPENVLVHIIDAWKSCKKGILIPVYNGRRGHPVLIDTRYNEHIRHLDREKGLKQLMIKFADDIHHVETNLPEILRDIDTPEDYSREIDT